MLTSLYSLFYVTGECYRFLHRGRAKITSKSFSILCYECCTRVEVFKNLEETMHVQVGHLSKVSTFDLFEFLSKFFFQNLSFQTLGTAYLPVQLIYQCSLYAGVYGKSD